MKKDYEEPIIRFKQIYETDCLTASNDNWQEDSHNDGWGEWNP